MTKKFFTFAILIVVLAGAFAPHVAFGQATQAGCVAGGGTWMPNLITGGGNCLTKTGQVTGSGIIDTLVSPLFKNIGEFLMMISSFVLIFSGMIFDWILKFTIVDMAKNIGGSSGVGASITTAWATLRDVANMFFIFVLLYAAFKAMFDTNFGNFGKTVRDIIIVALLINFSLFFSKVIIDASNIVSVGFYNSITSSNAPLTGSKYVMGSVSNFRGISGGYMNMLKMQTLYSADILTARPGNPPLGPLQILLIGVMSSVFMLITAIMLLIAGIMFAARFIILIFLMILSPLALIAYIIPGQSKHFDDWLDALKNQSFFAPLYFALTWVVFKLGTSLLDTIKNSGMEPQKDFANMFNEPGSAVALLINYVLIIGFSIAALIFAKQMATKGAAGTAFKTVAGGIGAAAIGGAALAGRNTIGRASSLISESQREKWSKSAAGRAGLWLADRGKKGSFDARGLAETKVGKAANVGDVTGIAGKFSGKGGYEKAVKDKVEAKTKYAKEVYGQTDFEKDEAKKREDRYKIEKYAEEERIKKERKDKAEAMLTIARTTGDAAKIKAAEDELKEVEFKNKNKIFEDDEYLATFKEGIKAEYEKYAKAGERRQEAYAKRLEKTGNILTAAGGIVGAAVGGLAGGIPGAGIGAGVGVTLGRGNKAAARKIRDESKGPSKEKRLADAYKAIADTEAETTPPAAPAAPAPAAPVPGGGGSTP